MLFSCSMTDGEQARVLFREVNPDHYILTSEAEVALGAAWQVLQSFELQQYGKPKFYTDDRREGLTDRLRESGEERPYSDIFAVEVHTSWDDDDKVNLMVSNRNGQGDEGYRAILRSVVSTVGIEEKPS